MTDGALSWLLVPQLILTDDQIILLDILTPSRNSVLSSPRTGCILEAMTIWFMCQLSPTIDGVKMFKIYEALLFFSF